MLVAVFLLVFTSQNISTKRSPNAMKLFGDFFLDIRDPGSFRRGPKDGPVAHEAPGRSLVAHGAHVAPFDLTPPL